MQSNLCSGGPESGAIGHRRERLEHILLDEIQTLIRDEAADPALDGVRLVSLRLSVDDGHARIIYAVEGRLSDEHRLHRTSAEALERATGFLRARLAGLLDLKRLPKLSFAFVGIDEPGSAGPQEGGEPWLG